MRILQLIAGLAVLITASFAHAQSDGKAYPGAFCQPTFNTDAIYRDSSGKMWNNSASAAQLWICPIIRDVENVYPNESAMYVQVLGIDRNSSQNINCTLYSMTSAGTTTYDSESRSTSGVSVNAQNLEFLNVSTSGDATYHLRCSIPATQNGARSGIIYYKVYEKE